MIRLTHKQDLAFASIAQESLVSGTILPSGLQVPRDGSWIMKGACVVLRSDSRPKKSKGKLDHISDELKELFSTK